MTKTELIARLAEQNPTLYRRDIVLLVSTILETITQALEDGNRVELRGFGTFSVRHREERIGRNPSTGEQVIVKAKNIVHFNMGKNIRDRLNKD